MSLEETKRKYFLTSLHKRSFRNAIESDDSTEKTPTRRERSSSQVELGRAKKRSFTKRKKKSVTPRRRKARRSKSSDHSQESTPNLRIFDRMRRKIESSDSEDTVLLYHSPRNVRRTPVTMSGSSSPAIESPIFDPRRRKGSKRSVKSSEGRSGDELLRDVPPKYLRQIAITISDAETDELHLRKDYVPKTYEAHGTKGKSAENEKKNLMDTGTSDRLWEEFVKKNYDNIVKYLKPVVTNDSRDDEPPFKRMALSPATNSATQTRRYAGEKNDGESQRIRREASFGKENPRSKAARRPKTTKATQRHGRRKVAPNPSGNWMDSADEYFNPLLEDVQFEKGGQNGGRMSFSEFRKAQNVEKAMLRKYSEPAQVLIVSPLNADENWRKSLMTTGDSSLERLKRFASNSDLEDPQPTRATIGETVVRRVKEVATPIDTDTNLPRKRKVVDISNKPSPSTSGDEEIEGIPLRELRKIHRMRKYAQRLNMNQSASGLARSPVKMKQEKVESRASTSQVDLTVGKNSDSGKMHAKMQSRKGTPVKIKQKKAESRASTSQVDLTLGEKPDTLKVHSKMQSRKTDRAKPIIKSIEVLTDRKLKKQYESWVL